jgi:ketosteroid isomerase-like protein
LQTVKECPISEPSTAELVERLSRLENERAVLSTLYAYGEALDYGNEELFLDCFTPDADYFVDMRLGRDGSFSFHGHDQLTGYFQGHTHAPDAYHKHVTVNPNVTCTGDVATATSYFLRVDATAESGPAFVLASGRYVDALIRDAAGKWRIRTRRCEVENM